MSLKCYRRRYISPTNQPGPLRKDWLCAFDTFRRPLLTSFDVREQRRQRQQPLKVYPRTVLTLNRQGTVVWPFDKRTIPCPLKGIVLVSPLYPSNVISPTDVCIVQHLGFGISIPVQYFSFPSVLVSCLGSELSWGLATEPLLWGKIGYLFCNWLKSVIIVISQIKEKQWVSSNQLNPA
jgi:hypothetical protein